MIENNNSFVAWHQVASSDILSIANTHWLRFPPPSCAQHVLVAIVYTLVAAFGLAGNLLIIVTLFTKSLRKHTNLLCANLAIADFLMNLEIPFLIRNSLTCGPKYFSFTGCQVYGFTGTLSGTVAIASITGMAHQRYLKITRPFNQRNDCRLRNSVTAVIFCWAYGLLLAIIPLITEKAMYAPEGYLTSCSFDYLSSDTYHRIYILVFGITAYFGPLCLIIFFYTRILQEVHDVHREVIELHRVTPTKRREQLKKGKTSERKPIEIQLHDLTGLIPGLVALRAPTMSLQEQRIVEAKARLEKKLMKTISLLITCWTIAWTPHALVRLAGVLSLSSLISPLTSMLPALMAKCSSVIDPYIYFYSHPRYRREVMLVWQRACRRSIVLSIFCRPKANRDVR